MLWNNLLWNNKSSATHFLIKVLLITVIFQSEIMTSFFEIWLPFIVLENGPWPLRLLKCWN